MDRNNDYIAINAFAAKLELGHRRIQKGNAAFFPKLDRLLPSKKTKLNLGELKVEVESHLRLL